MENLIEVGVYSTFAEGCDHGLVVLALGQPYWLIPFDQGFRLLVEPHAFEAVREQLTYFDRERTRWPPRPVEENLPRRKTELVTPLLWSLVILAVFRAQLEWPGWTVAGALDARAIFDRGEWWRVVTALFLHADFGHLVSNGLSGIFVFSAVLSTIGWARGWLLVVLASIAGNLAVAAMSYSSPHQSLGASTAIFAGFGLLTGRAVRVVRQSSHPKRWRAMFVPLASGLTVLGLFGAGEMHIDVMAHGTGFAAGLILGVAAAFQPPTR